MPPLFSDGYFAIKKVISENKKNGFSQYFLVKAWAHCAPPHSCYIKKPRTIRVKPTRELIYMYVCAHKAFISILC